MSEEQGNGPSSQAGGSGSAAEAAPPTSTGSVASVDADGNWRAEGTGVAKTGVPIAVVLGVALGVMCLCAVPVTGILAAIAIPNFLAMQLRAKRAEAPANLDAIRTAEKAYHAEWDAFTSVGPCPPFVPGREQVAWDPSWECYQQFMTLGWLPDGMTRCSYEVTAVPGASASSDDFQGIARCDVDGDGYEAEYHMNRAEKSSMYSYNNVY